jgi:carbonic anhydrase
MIDIIYRYDPAFLPPAAAPASPEDARRRLCDGNRDFIGLVDLPAGGERATRVIPFDLTALGVAKDGDDALLQQPFAIVLGCSDARVPTELIFRQTCNSLFVVRVAGNVLGNECLGSIEYAVQHLGRHVKLLVVLGHSGCGAVTAAVDTFLEPARYLAVANSQALRAIVDGLLLAVRAAAAQAPGYRAALVETAVALNAAMTAKTLKHEFRDAGADQLQVVYGVYHLVSREVDLLSKQGYDGNPHLYDPPANEDEFRQLGIQLAGCPEIVKILHAM